MPIKVTCPKCQGVLHAPDDAGGKRGKCPTCGTVLSIPADGPKVPAASVPTEQPFRAPDSAPESQPATHRSSFGAIPRPSDAETRREVTGGGSRMPPPAFSQPEPKKLPDPFVKPARRSVVSSPGDGLVRAWRRTRNG